MSFSKTQRRDADEARTRYSSVSGHSTTEPLHFLEYTCSIPISARYYGNNIKYVGIKVNTTIKYQTLGYVEGIPIMNIWEDFVNSEVINA